MKLETLFPVQKQVIPIILNSDRSQSIYPNDICVTAPTGSGKTLTYVLPIIEGLRNRISPCCRAIVLLPVSDLAEQVYSVFKNQLENDESSHLINKETECEKNDLKVMLLSTKTSFLKEQAILINQQHSKCLIDIIVTTPGRLVDHIQKTKGFCLNELRYLVLDECDRIMDQIKQNWLVILNQAVFGLNLNQRELISQESLNVHNLFIDKKRLMPYQKLLLSATLTRNPEKLEQVDLFKPIYFSVSAEKLQKKIESESSSAAVLKETNENIEATSEPSVSKETIKTKLENVENANDISVPDELNELFIEVVASQKPLIAIHMIKTLGYRRMLCFVKSIDTAKRLTKLFELNGITAMEYSSSLHVARRKRVQAKFEQDRIDVLVCSDVMARGMDLEKVDYVLLYDSASHLNAYVHKVGRTARAGRTGTAISFLEHKEIYFFKKMMLQIKNKTDENSESKPHKVKEFKIPKSKFKPLLETYRESLSKLKEALKEKPIKETDSNSKHEEKDKSGKRKHVKERNTKFIKRFKQVAD